MNEKLITEFMQTHSGKRAKTLLLTHGLEIHSVFAMVYEQVHEVLAYLNEGRNYKLTEFFGDDPRWIGMKKGPRCAAGMCVAFIARKHHVDLEIHFTKSGGGSKKYHLPIPAEHETLHVACPRFTHDQFQFFNVGA